MNRELYHHLRAIVEIQNARRRNFAGKTEPQDPALEARHLEALDDHRKGLDRIEAKMRSERERNHAA
jgi:hypothetical protein